MARLAGVPVFLWLVLGPDEAGDWWAVGLLIAAGASDWLDGKIARALNQQSRLGELLDPAADRLYIVATLVALAIRSIIPWWLVALLAAREVVLGVVLLRAAAARLRPAAGQLRRQGRDTVPVLRVPAAVPGRSPGTLRRGGPGRRLGVRDLGNSPVLVRGRALPRAGRQARRREVGAAAGGPPRLTDRAVARSGHPVSRRETGQREGSGDGGRRGHQAAPDDREPAQAAAAGGQQADHGARAAAAASGTVSPRRWSPCSSSPRWCGTTSATARTSA